MEYNMSIMQTIHIHHDCHYYFMISAYEQIQKLCASGYMGHRGLGSPWWWWYQAPKS